MIFPSVEFLLLFLPSVFAGYFVCQRLLGPYWSKWFLVAASFVFYWYGSGWYCVLFAASVCANYWFGHLLGTVIDQWSLARRRWLLTGAIAFNIGILGYYKYADFILSTVNQAAGSQLPLLNLALPIGISFWTFQMIAYVVDAHRGKTLRYSFQNYLNFIAFFPHLLVGPIVHHKELTSQFELPGVTKPNADNLALGLFLIALGAAKKLFLADPLTTPSQAGFDAITTLSTYDAWLHAVSYTISYYFDLSGYADMAIGLALLFNIQLPANFDSPYKATNFADYWRRWHITLSRFLGDYVFRSIFRKEHGPVSFYGAVFVTFAVSGLWHGAGWTFVLWGVLNGIFVMAAHAMERWGIKLPVLVGWAFTFLGVVLLRVLFVSANLEEAGAFYQTMFQWRPEELKAFASEHMTQILWLAVGCALVFFAPNSTQWRQRFRPNALFTVATAALLTCSLMAITKVADFLYLQF